MKRTNKLKFESGETLDKLEFLQEVQEYFDKAGVGDLVEIITEEVTSPCEEFLDSRNLDKSNGFYRTRIRFKNIDVKD